MALSPERVFDGHFRRLGGRVPDMESIEDVHVGIPALKRIVSDFRKWMQWFVEPTKLCRNRIHGDLLRSGEFNAYAAALPEFSLDLIGVTLPVLFSLETLTGLAARYFLHGRPPAPLAERLRATRWTDIGSVKELLKTVPAYDHSNEQKITHKELYESCLSCLVMHEVGHIAFGHVDFIRAEFGATEMAETGSAFGVPPDLKHIMELEADRGIAHHIANMGQEKLDVALTSCLLLFDLLTERSKLVDSHGSDSHPHPIVRFSSIIMNFGDMTGQSKAGSAALARLNSRQSRWIGGGLAGAATMGLDMMGKEAMREMDRLWCQGRFSLCAFRRSNLSPFWRLRWPGLGLTHRCYLRSPPLLVALD